MMNTHDTDVVVVGARAAGAATAMLLARAGLDVVVVDRARHGSDTLSTHALMRGGVIQLHRWGLLDRIRAAGTPAIRHTTFHLAGGSTVVDILPGHGIDALYAPRRTVLDPLLASAAADSGATVRFGFTVNGLLRDADGRVSGVVGTDRVGRTTRINARYVVGVDGAVRSSPNTSTPRSTRPAMAPPTTCTDTGPVSRPTDSSGCSERA